SATAIDTAPMATTRSGSTILVSVGRGQRGAFAPPTDNKGNSYAQLDETHAYTRWPDSGVAVYAAAGMTGGDGLVVSTATPPSDEITLAAVEVVEGARVQAFAWREVLDGATPSRTSGRRRSRTTASWSSIRSWTRARWCRPRWP